LRKYFLLREISLATLLGGDVEVYGDKELGKEEKYLGLADW
jgi:hypothetical protein